jgi:hypothetical protein
MTATDTPGADATEASEGSAIAAEPDDDRGAAPVDTAATPGEAAGPDGQEGPAWLSDRLVGRLALALTLGPLVVGGLALIFAVGDQYTPISDHALTELQTRSVGRDEVLVGLYSRDEWNHPGPMLFYILAPFYWLTGGMSVGLNIGALAINGGSVAGMGLLARRRGGTPLMLVTLLSSALLMRMLGAEFLHDPWNCFVTTLPFGLLVFLTWSMWRGDMWAFPVGALVATFLAQAHVGFVALATPLLAWGAVGLVASVALETDGQARSARLRSGVKMGLVGAGVLAVGWLPAAIEALQHSPSNVAEIVHYFRHPDGDTHSLVEGWRVMSGQFGGAPEWLTYKHEFSFGGQSPFFYSAPIPWMLVALVVAGIVLWRRQVVGTFSLLATLGLTFVVGMVAVARTVGLAFDYRLRWTLIPAMVALVVIGWAGWTLAADRWPRAPRRVLTPLALAALTVVGGVNVFTAATAGTPQNDDSAAVASLSDQVLDYLPDDEGTVLVNDAFHSGAWHARGLVLQLERGGIDVGVDESLLNEYGHHRVIEPGTDISTLLVVTRDEYVDDVAARPGMRLIAEWQALPEDELVELEAQRDLIGADLAAGRITYEVASPLQMDLLREMTNDELSTAYRAAVFIDERYGTPAPPAG